MFRKNAAEEQVRLIEHLKNYCWQIIDMYQEGSGPGAKEPMTPALAKLLIGEEISRQLSVQSKPKDPSPAHLRISGDSKLKILEILLQFDVIALRWLGARAEGDDVVVYATVRCTTIKQLAEVIVELEKGGLDVRDGTYGIFLK